MKHRRTVEEIVGKAVELGIVTLDQDMEDLKDYYIHKGGTAEHCSEVLMTCSLGIEECIGKMEDYIDAHKELNDLPKEKYNASVHLLNSLITTQLSIAKELEDMLDLQ